MSARRAVALFVALAGAVVTPAGAHAEVRVATFAADVTVPLGHRLMGVLPVKSKEIVDALEARGVVLLARGELPVVIVAVDWCEIRNGAYERWREVLAAAAGTSRERVLVSSVHQHDAPVADLDAERLLADVGLAGELLDVAFHEHALERVASALRASLAGARVATYVGVGAARVERVASSRRVVHPDGSVRFDRGSRSGGDAFHRDAPAGEIDPTLRTVSFWDGETPFAALHAYSTHPMSYYGEGGVSADFVGIARRELAREMPGVFQIYCSGASGDVTAGKHNDGSSAGRKELAERLARAMRASWKETRRARLEEFALRSTPLALAFRADDAHGDAALERTLRDASLDVRARILAAMGLASRRRLERPIDVPCVDLGATALVLLPGEVFAGFQIAAQRIRSDIPVVTIGYGECWPGYVPTERAFADGFTDDWLWVARGSGERVVAALWRVLPDPRRRRAAGGTTSGTTAGAAAGTSAAPVSEPMVRDVWSPSAAHPRYSEGSIIELRDGRLAFAITEFAGGAEDHASARIVVGESADRGGTWSEQRVLQENIGAQNVMSVSLLRLRRPLDDAIGVFYLVKHGPSDLRVELRVSDDELRTLGESIRVTHEPGYHVMNNDRVVRLVDGRLLAPIASTRDVREENHFVSFCALSDDGGRTWRRGRGPAERLVVDLPQRGAMEPGVVELRDGRVLMVVRTQLGSIYGSISGDRGETWSPAMPWPSAGAPIASPEAPATLARIPSTGDLLLVWNPHVVEGAGHGGPRTPLAAAVSLDDGASWRPSRVLESDAALAYAYTSAAFSGDRVFLSYYVHDLAAGTIGTRLRSAPLASFYGDTPARPLCVAAISCESRIRDPAFNLARIEHWTRRAAAAGADLALFPECALDGWWQSRENRAFAATIDGPAIRRLVALARELGIVLAVGMTEIDSSGVSVDGADGERAYITHAVLDGCGVIARHRKRALAGGESGEAQIWERGDGATVFDVGGHRIGIAICYESVEPATCAALRTAGASVILAPYANGTTPAEIRDPARRARRWIWERVDENRVWYIACDATPRAADGTLRAGAAFAIAPDGELRACSPDDGAGEAMVVVDVSGG